LFTFDGGERILPSNSPKEEKSNIDNEFVPLLQTVGLLVTGPLSKPEDNASRRYHSDWVFSTSVLILNTVMANNEILTDEYVASLLAKDAKESSIKYSALGLEGFATSK
jgi:hypothetical protein